MQRFFLALAISFTVLNSKGQELIIGDTAMLQNIEITAFFANPKTPVAKTNLGKKEIQKNNIGQDLPFILNQTPAVVVNSDAGNGIGYTGIRIRGSDASRINVTLNGIPYNDAESQGTFFVDLPDIASSTSGIQIQRGVGTSTNGAGAFGGSILLNTNELITKPGITLNSSAGSYNSFKNTLMLNSGLVNKHFTFDGRLSSIKSDGFIDRARADLKSFYTSAAYTDQKNSVRLNVFSGKEQTYQAWYGIDENTLKSNRRFNSAGLEKPDDPYNNETDNYTQTHTQLFLNHRFSKYLKTNVTLFFTKGKGYYEQYKAKAKLSSYGLPNYITGTDTVKRTDLIRRLWLDNDFYGTVFSLQYERGKTQIITGGGYNEYRGNHFGEIIWSKQKEAIPSGFRWYDNDALKKDFNVYTKFVQQLSANWQTYIDLQLRTVDYTINGFRNNPDIVLDNQFLFFNPKAGITYSNNQFQLFASYARANKEPNRDDFESGIATQPQSEQLNDFELGVSKNAGKYSWSTNLYYMQYNNQLILTGKVNDVGAYTRTNVRKSYRAGIELQGLVKAFTWLTASGNIAFSNNKIRNFTEFIDDYDNGGQVEKSYKKTTIAFSPTVVSSANVVIIPTKKVEVTLISKYVSRQFLDNTANIARSLNGYYTQDARIDYKCAAGKKLALGFFAQAINIFSKKYEPNGYTFSHVSGGSTVTENFYYPMAPINFVAGVSIKL